MNDENNFWIILCITAFVTFFYYKYSRLNFMKKLELVISKIQNLDSKIFEIDNTQKIEADEILKSYKIQTYSDNEIENNLSAELTKINVSIKKIESEINALITHSSEIL